ncbi:MAG: DUF3224 domain-containing protein [Arenimonas sp.]
MGRATGRFDVRRTAQAQSPEEGALLARHELAKVFHGDLDGTGTGVMLSVGTAVEGSAAYSALEVVQGRLHGLEGSFALQHAGVMTRGAPSLSIRVVPDSGTGELIGLDGTLGIRIDAGVHHYDFDYSLPARDDML